MELTKTKYKKTEVGLIPENWDCLSINHSCYLKHGFQFREEHFTKSGIGVVKIGSLQDNKGLDASNMSFVSEDLANTLSKFLLNEGDVLMALTGGTLGKVCKVDTNQKLLQNYRVGNFIPNKGVSKDFIYQILNSFYLKKAVKKLVNEAAQPNFGKQDFDKLFIPLPPTLIEQQAIATALSDLDELITNLEKLIAKKKAIKQGAMQQLLTPPHKGGKRLAGFTVEWERIRLSKVITVARGGSPRPIQEYITTNANGINWIKIGDTSPKSKFITSSVEKIIPEGIQNSRKVGVGDFLLSNSMSFGRPYILKIDGCIHDGWLVLQNYNESFDTDFLYYTLMSSDVYSQYLMKASGSSVLNLNKEIVKTVELNRPKDMVEQKAIARILSEMDLEVDALESKLFKAKSIKQGMMQELLTGKTRLV
jgi:type I restriction enzyme S subunit